MTNYSDEYFDLPSSKSASPTPSTPRPRGCGAPDDRVDQRERWGQHPATESSTPEGSSEALATGTNQVLFIDGDEVKPDFCCIHCGTPLARDSDGEWWHAEECPEDSACYRGELGPTPRYGEVQRS